LFRFIYLYSILFVTIYSYSRLFITKKYRLRSYVFIFRRPFRRFELAVSRSIFLFVHLLNYPPFYNTIHLFILPFIILMIFPFDHPFFYLTIHYSITLFIFPSFCLYYAFIHNIRRSTIILRARVLCPMLDNYITRPYVMFDVRSLYHAPVCYTRRSTIISRIRILY